MRDVSIPFGGGSRSKSNEILICFLYILVANISQVCIGLHLARIELRLAAALFFRRFPNARVSAKEGMGDEDMFMRAYFLMAPDGHRCLIEA